MVTGYRLSIFYSYLSNCPNFSPASRDVLIISLCSTGIFANCFTSLKIYGSAWVSHLSQCSRAKFLATITCLWVSNYPWWRLAIDTIFASQFFVREIQRSPVDFHHKGTALMVSLSFAWTGCWINSRVVDSTRPVRGHVCLKSTIHRFVHYVK